MKKYKLSSEEKQILVSYENGEWVRSKDYWKFYSRRRRKTLIPKNRVPSHPGEVLLEDFLIPKKMSQVDLARKMHVPIQRINTLINAKIDVSPETAILLSRVLGTTPEFWMNLQVSRDLAIAQQSMVAAIHRERRINELV